MISSSPSLLNEVNAVHVAHAANVGVQGNHPKKGVRDQTLIAGRSAAQDPMKSSERGIQNFFYISVAVTFLLLLLLCGIYLYTENRELGKLRDRIRHLESKETFEDNCENFLLSLDRDRVLRYLLNK